MWLFSLFVFNLSFLIYAFKILNFHLTTALTTFQRFWYVVYFFSTLIILYSFPTLITVEKSSATPVHLKTIFYSTLLYYIIFAFVILKFHYDVTMCGFFNKLFIWLEIHWIYWIYRLWSFMNSAQFVDVLPWNNALVTFFPKLLGLQIKIH